MDLRDRVRGMLLGGAVGDALGAPLEFQSEDEIGLHPVREFLPGHYGAGRITDDTQMTLFTAEAMVRAGPDGDLAAETWAAYQRWHGTQAGRTAVGLASEPFLLARRAPGTTCMTAIEGGTPGSVDVRLNDSKGCGGVMRIAPLALSADPFGDAVVAAALTHSHPSGYLSAGAGACILADILAGAAVLDAVDRAADALAGWDGHDETSAALHAAVSLAGSDELAHVSSLGEGWVGEEALAIAVFCALVADSWIEGVSKAVTHGGDSDSTGAICGNILGAALGPDAIPAALRGEVEGADVILRIADSLVEAFG